MGRKFTIFALLYFVFKSKFHVQAPWGAYIQRGDLTEGFLRYDFEGLIHGGAYFLNVMIFSVKICIFTVHIIFISHLWFLFSSFCFCFTF